MTKIKTITFLVASFFALSSHGNGVLGDISKYDQQIEDREKAKNNPSITRCPEVKADLLNIRNAQLEFKKDGKTLQELNNEYDQEMANFVLLQGIYDLKKDFTKNISRAQEQDPSIKKFKNQAKLIDENTETLTRLAILQGFMDELQIGTPLTSDDFFQVLKRNCSNDGKNLELCTVIKSDNKTNEVFLKNFYMAFQAATKGENENEKKEAMTKLSELLKKDMPKEVLEGKTLSRLQDLKNLANKIQQNKIENHSSHADIKEQTALFQKSYKEYLAHLKAFSTGEKYQALVKSINLEEKLGALKETSDILAQRKSNSFVGPELVKNTLTRYYQQKRIQEFRAQEKNANSKVNPMPDIEKMGLPHLYNLLASETKKVCPQSNGTNTLDDDGMMTCLKEVSEDQMNKLLSAQESKIKTLFTKIDAIKNTNDFQNLLKMQKTIAVLGSDVCQKQNDGFEILQCSGIEGNGLWSGTQNEVDFLMDSTGKIISSLDPHLKSLDMNRQKAVHDLAEICKNWKMGELASNTCSIAKSNQRVAQRPSYKDHFEKRRENRYIDYDRHGNELRSKPRDVEGQIAGGMLSRAITQMGPFAMQYMQQEQMLTMNTQIGYQIADYKYRQDLAWQRQYAFMSGMAPFNGYNFGSVGTFPAGINPLSSSTTSFQLPSSSMYFGNMASRYR